MKPCPLAILGVQPLRLKHSEQALSCADVLHDEGDPGVQRDPEQMPPWVRELEALYPNGHFRYRRLTAGQSFVADDVGYTLAAYLCSNTVLNQHLVLFDVRRDAPVDPGTVHPARLRAMLVRPAEAGDEQRPDVIRAAIEQACDEVQRTRARILPGQPHEEGDIIIEHDSCNVTVFVDATDVPPGEVSGPGGSDALRGFYIHDRAERVTVDRIDLHVSDRTRVFFGGRVHHVISASEGDLCVIRQIMFMLQVTWYYVPTYLREASRWHRQMLLPSPQHDLDEVEAAARQLIHVYQTVRLQSEFAKFSWGVLGTAVYEPCAKRWGVERLVDQFERYATFFRGFIKDTREVRTRKSERLLNYVLAALGVFGIVGLWANILQSQASARELGSFAHLFAISRHTTLGYTTLLFLLVSLLTAAGLIFWSVRIRRGGRRWRRRRRHSRRSQDA